MGGCEPSGLTIGIPSDPGSNGGSTGATVTGGASGATGSSATTPPSGAFLPAGMMNVARAYHTATLLPDGRVLLVGGWQAGGSAELFDPTSGRFTPTGSLKTARLLHRAVLLPSGKVLVSGGAVDDGDVVGQSPSLSSAELYDPRTGRFASAGNMTMARLEHSATLLPNGLVLLAGARADTTQAASAELYDPKTGKFTPTGAMTVPRNSHSATLLPNGLVLLAGGMDYLFTGTQHAELYHPATGTFAPTADMTAARMSPFAALLSSGKVLVAGGGYRLWPDASDAKAELYDGGSGGGAFTAISDLTIGRAAFTASPLASGRVLFVGGHVHYGYGSEYLKSAEVYDPSDGSFVLVGDLNLRRFDATATLLHDGRVLIAGGISDLNAGPSIIVQAAELYQER